MPLSFHHRDSTRVDLRIDLPELFQDRESLEKMVTGLRTKYPFLKNWFLSEAQRCWDHSVLQFNNVAFYGISEFDVNTLIEVGGKFNSRGSNLGTVPFDELLPSLSGGIVDSHQSYMGVFLLGLLVRYRPEIWVHSINGRSTELRGYDDHCMAMIESLLDITLNSYPQYVKKCLEAKLN